MILDEGCAERGCPMHDERETKGVVFIHKEWVGLTDEEFRQINRSTLSLPIEDVLPAFATAIEAKLKEKNT